MIIYPLLVIAVMSAIISMASMRLPFMLSSIIESISWIVGSICVCLCLITITFGKKHILDSSVITKYTLPDTNVVFIRENGELKEIKIGNEIYNHIECKSDSQNSLTIIKEKSYVKWWVLTYAKKEIQLAVIE